MSFSVKPVIPYLAQQNEIERKKHCVFQLHYHILDHKSGDIITQVQYN